MNNIETIPQPQPGKFERGHPAYRPDIDGLRAFAVFSVVAFHVFPAHVPGGFIGVDIFFVISGFLISSILIDNLEKDRLSFVEFYSRRIRRIFPALILVLAACWIFGWIVLLPGEYRQLGKHVIGAAEFAVNFVLWHEAGYFDNASATKPLLHLWSLGVEEQFYIFWPLAAWLAWRWKLGFGKFTALICVLSFALNLKWAHHYPLMDFYWPLSRLWELMAGGLLAHMNRRPSGILPVFIRREGAGGIMALLGAALIATAIFCLNKDMPFPGWPGLLPVAGTCLIVAAGPDAWLNKNILAARAAVGFGLISYPLYLWHWPLLSFAHIIESKTPAPLVRLALVFVSIVLAWLTYEWIEKPIRFGAKRRAKTAALIGLMILTGAIGFATLGTGGFPRRAWVELYQDNENELIRIAPADDACRHFIGRQDFLFDTCRYFDGGGRRTVALIGDSHAQVTYAGFAEVLAERGVNLLLLANSGCPLLLGTVTGKTPDEREQCHAKIGQLLSIIADHKEIKTVYISARGPGYFTGLGFGSVEQDDKNSRILWPYGASKPPANAGALYRDGLQRTVDFLRNAGKRVYYIEENPEAGFETAICIDRPLRLASPHCTVAKSAVLERQAQYRALLKTVSGVTLIDPLPAFCPDDQCYFLNDGRLLYADNNHLSVAGSRFLAQHVLVNYLDDRP